MKKYLLTMLVILALSLVLVSCDFKKENSSSHIHNYGEWNLIKIPTCTEKGEVVRYCSCGDMQNEAVLTSNHTPANPVEENRVEASCTTTGSYDEVVYCSSANCGVEISRTTKVIDILDHSFDEWQIINYPTLTQEGLKERYCECGEKQMQIMDKLVPSEGLNFAPDSNGEGYILMNIGTCTDTDIVIPRLFDGLPVTSIEVWAFEGCTTLTSVVIPDSVTSIGIGAFYNCTSLVRIEIPNSVTSIGIRAFDSCTSLKSIVMGTSVSNVGDYAFYNCTSLESVVIGNSVTSIGACAFSGCTSLERIEIPNSVISIGIRAFDSCTSLTSVVIPDSVAIIGNAAFFDCTSLTSINYEGTVEQWGEINKGDSWNYNVPATQVICSDGVIELN